MDRGSIAPMPSRADETAALVRESGRDARGASSSSARVVTAAGVLVAFAGVAGVAGVARAAAWSSSPAALGDGEARPLGGQTAAPAPSTAAPTAACDRLSDQGSCSKYAEDARECAPTTDWSVDSCVPHADAASSAATPWISAYYACVNGAADDVERPYGVPSATPRRKARFLEVLAEIEQSDGPSVTAAEAEVKDGKDVKDGALEAALGSFQREEADDDAVKADAAYAAAYLGKAASRVQGDASSSAGPSTYAAPSPRKDEPYVWAFVHVPKSAGSYVTEIFRAHIWRLRERGDRALARRARVAARVNARAARAAAGAADVSRDVSASLAGDVRESSRASTDGRAPANASAAFGGPFPVNPVNEVSVPSSFQDDAFHPLYSGQSYAPVMDLTEPHFRDVFQFYRGASDAIPADWYAPGFGPPANQNAPRGAARSFHAGRREVFKGSLAMGFCDAVRFPCGYVTVLRDPMERLFSHHAYSCAAGAENRAGWTPEMRAAGACDLDPAAYFEKVGGVDVSVQLLAPRANPASRCALEQAKANLVKPCVFFLLQERLRDGIASLAAAVPGFAGLDEDPPASFVHAPAMGADVEMLSGKNQVAPGSLSEAQKANLARWRRDEGVVKRLKTLAAREIELYEFATREYENQWNRDGVGSC